MDLYTALICFPVIFLGELPDKTMFASLLLATRGRPGQVWLGAAAAFAVHVAIAVAIGVAVVALLPRRQVDLVVAALFLAGAVYVWIEGTRQEKARLPGLAARRRPALAAFVFIFLAEWGDLTQVLTANLAARYQQPLAVAAGSLLALWTVAALAVIAGQVLLRFLSVSLIRKVTAGVLVVLAGFTAWSALG